MKHIMTASRQGGPRNLRYIKNTTIVLSILKVIFTIFMILSFPCYLSRHMLSLKPNNRQQRGIFQLREIPFPPHGARSRKRSTFLTHRAIKSMTPRSGSTNVNPFPLPTGTGRPKRRNGGLIQKSR